MPRLPRTRSSLSFLLVFVAGLVAHELIDVARAQTQITGSVRRDRRTRSIEKVPGGARWDLTVDILNANGQVVAQEPWQVRVSDRHVIAPSGSDSGIVLSGSVATAAVNLFANLDALLDDLKVANQIPLPE